MRKRAESPVAIQRSSEVIESPVTRPEPRPEGGRTAYLNLLKESLVYPQQALDQGIEGDVEITFTVGGSGDLSDYRVTKSLGSGCDEEAIRLIREGPAWTPAESEGTPITKDTSITIEFRIEQ